MEQLEHENRINTNAAIQAAVQAGNLLGPKGQGRFYESRKLSGSTWGPGTTPLGGLCLTDEEVALAHRFAAELGMDLTLEDAVRRVLPRLEAIVWPKVRCTMVVTGHKPGSDRQEEISGQLRDMLPQLVGAVERLYATKGYSFSVTSVTDGATLFGWFYKASRQLRRWDVPAIARMSAAQIMSGKFSGETFPGLAPGRYWGQALAPAKLAEVAKAVALAEMAQQRQQTDAAALAVAAHEAYMAYMAAVHGSKEGDVKNIVDYLAGREVVPQAAIAAHAAKAAPVVVQAPVAAETQPVEEEKPSLPPPPPASSEKLAALAAMFKK